MEQLLVFIPEQLFILIAAVYIIGIFLKKTEKISDNLIPIILMVFSVIFSLVLDGPGAVPFLQGVICWGIAVGVNQTYKQIRKLSEDLE